MGTPAAMAGVTVPVNIMATESMIAVALNINWRFTKNNSLKNFYRTQGTALSTVKV